MFLNTNLYEQNMMNTSDANNEVHPAAAATEQGCVARSVSQDVHVEPMFFIDSLRVIANHGVPTDPGRRRNRRRGQPLPADPFRFCTNLHCMARKTPMWRSGPLGPRTLCNACGIYYNKHVIRGKVPGIIIHEDGSSSAFVPPIQSVEGDSSTS